jgi:hypothetical protein
MAPLPSVGRRWFAQDGVVVALAQSTRHAVLLPARTKQSGPPRDGLRSVTCGTASQGQPITEHSGLDASRSMVGAGFYLVAAAFSTLWVKSRVPGARVDYAKGASSARGARRERCRPRRVRRCSRPECRNSRRAPRKVAASALEAAASVLEAGAIVARGGGARVVTRVERARGRARGGSGRLRADRSRCRRARGGGRGRPGRGSGARHSLGTREFTRGDRTRSRSDAPRSRHVRLREPPPNV